MAGGLLPLTVIDMGNDTHVSDVVLLVHQLTDLVDGAAITYNLSGGSDSLRIASLKNLQPCTLKADSQAIALQSCTLLQIRVEKFLLVPQETGEARDSQPAAKEPA